ncbi:MAG: hypothetical protein KF764_31135 [Labilithrix sp.]|nr:hypothetical protein [Labilithrix sp.]
MSDYNPYAAPVAEAPATSGVPVQGEPQPWSIGEVVSGGWHAYKTSWAPLTFGYLVVTLLGALPGQVAPMAALAGSVEEGTPGYYALHVPLTFLGWLVAEFFMAGFTRAAMRAVRTNDASFGDFFGAGARFLPFVGMSFLKSAAVVLGATGFLVAATLAALQVVSPAVAVAAVVFIVPGVIIALGFSNAPFYVIDQNLGAVSSLQASWASTRGHKGHLFALVLVEVGVMLLGMAACCLGVFAAVPVMLLARAIVYMRLSGTAPVPAAPPGPYAPPPGPFGGSGGPPGGAPGSYGSWGPPGSYGGGGPGGQP